MNPLWILLLGVAIVVGGILALRLHTFLSLIAGALLIALLTPTHVLYRFSLRAGDVQFVSEDAAAGTVLLKSPTARPAGSPLLVLAAAGTPTGYHQIAMLQVIAQPSKGTTLARFVGGESSISSRDFIVDPAIEAAARKEMGQTIGQRIGDGFGETAAGIGILIAMAAVLGQTLMESGAAERIVLGLRQAVGEERAGLAFLLSGFVLAALVLSDTTFYLLIPLAQVMRVRSGKDYLLYILSITAGAVMTHSLVPPAAGPAMVATQLNVGLFTMIVGGVIVGGIASTSGYFYALWANRRWVIPLRGAVGVSEAELERIASRDESALPPLWLSLLPILLPVALIAAGDIGGKSRILATLGEKNVALTIAAAIGLFMVWFRRDATSQRSSAPVGQALASAGVMILIISAGGAFGFVVRQMDIAATVKDMLPASKLALLPLAFLVTTAVRTAQGSAIVAMVTATGIVAPIAAAGGLGYHPVYLALAIGCGSKPISWMNDAGFWIIAKMSGMTEGETLKTVSVMLAIMAVVGLAATMLGAWLLPMN